MKKSNWTEALKHHKVRLVITSVEEIKPPNYYKAGRCKYCGKEMPNKDWCTKNGCRWCDTEYWNDLQKQEEERKTELEKWNDPNIAY
jgi:tRNA(Ile2) C34 agmatinyltransferase TiaS